MEGKKMKKQVNCYECPYFQDTTCIIEYYKESDNNVVGFCNARKKIKKKGEVNECK